MPRHLLAEVGNRIPPRFGGESPNDVFLMVKAFISDVTLSQSILVVWPGTMANESMDALRRIASNQVPGNGGVTKSNCFHVMFTYFQCRVKHH